MGDDRPQGSGVFVGTGVNVGVSAGVTVAVLVTGAVKDALGVMIFPGAAQPDKTDKSKSQEMSLAFCPLERSWVRIIEGMERLIWRSDPRITDVSRFIQWI